MLAREAGRIGGRAACRMTHDLPGRVRHGGWARTGREVPGERPRLWASLPPCSPEMIHFKRLEVGVHFSGLHHCCLGGSHWHRRVRAAHHLGEG